MTIEQYSLGFDEDGVTQISYDALAAIAETGTVLEKVEIAGNDVSDIICSFIFKDHGIYNASGFSIGYGGEGPHGLHAALRLFHPDVIPEDFWETPISELMPDKKWAWKPKHGFINED